MSRKGVQLSVNEVERRFLEESRPLGLRVLRVSTWDRSSGIEAEDEHEPDHEFPAGGVVHIAEAEDRNNERQLIVFLRRQYKRNQGGVDLTVAVAFHIPEDLPINQARFKSLRKRLATGYCKDVAGPYMSAVAAAGIAMLTNIPVAPAWPSDFEVRDSTELPAGPEDEHA